MNQSTPTAAPLPIATKPLRVLYADDVKQLRELLSVILKRDGHEPETAEHGEEAFERLAHAGSAYDLLITDHHMPRLNGLELVRRLRTRNFPGKIIVFSSELSPDVDEEYRGQGVDLILAKPVFPLTFRLMLRQLFPGHYPPATEPATAAS